MLTCIDSRWVRTNFRSGENSCLQPFNENINRIIEEAINYFGEDNVDYKLSNAANTDNNPVTSTGSGVLNKLFKYKTLLTILIHWDKVTITNEDDRSTEIKDLFCRIKFVETRFKQMYFSRTTYTQNEWNSSYRHSHLPPLDRANPLSFDQMCLGRGPINDTIRALKTIGYPQETLSLFFWELDKVVHVESLQGVPYIRMESINTIVGDRIRSFGVLPHGMYLTIKKFIESFFGTVQIPLGFENGIYVLGCSFLEFALLVTNFYNKYKIKFPLIETSIIKKEYVLTNGAIHKKGNVREDRTWSVLVVPPIVFKGTDYGLVVSPSNNGAIETKKLVDLNVVKYIQRAYLALVNMKFCKSEYGKEQQKETKLRDQQIHALCTSFGVCTHQNPYGASCENTLLCI